MYILIVLLPLLSIFFNVLFFRQIGVDGVNVISCFSTFLSFVLSLAYFIQIVFFNNVYYIKLFTWVKIDLMEVFWGFQIDSLTIVMCVVVTSISTLVHLYSISYMSEDPHRSRFMIYLSLFTFFMLILVTADNYLQLFVGWEGVGLASYLLINFWYTRIQANKSAIKAILINRIGDFGLSLGIIIIFYTFRSLDFTVVLSTSYFFDSSKILFLNYYFNHLSLICFLLFIGSVGKSAQIGLHTWLPDAMEGPTPVSALIHAATMVTAGVFLIIRSSALFEFAPTVLLFMTFVGGITSFFAASIGLVQNDLKKIIAYSTCSQLGYMIFACGLSQYSTSLFHLTNHAFFKALLFLSAGVIIHGLGDEQDIRKMGGLIHVLPLTYSLTFIGSLALMGFPFLTGFYSKDLILELSFAHYSVKGHFVFWLGTLSALFTAFYSMRSLYLVFLANTNSFKVTYSGVHEGSLILMTPLIILGFGSIFIGFLLKDLMVGMGTDFWNNAIFIHPNNVIIDYEFIPIFIKWLPVICSLFGSYLAFHIYHWSNHILIEMTLNKRGYNLYSFLIKKWYFDKFYNYVVITYILHFGYEISFNTLDKGFFELIGPTGLSNLFLTLSDKTNKIQSGRINDYVFLMIYSLMILIFIANYETLSWYHKYLDYLYDLKVAMIGK